MFEICSIFIFTTNSRVRGERMTDRECIVEYERGHPSEEERESSKLAVSDEASSLLLDHVQLIQYQRARNWGCSEVDHGIWSIHS